MKIKAITAKPILDSRGIATVEVSIKTEQGVFIAQTPSGTSTGKYEAVSVTAEKAVYNVREIIAKKLVGRNFVGQAEIDQILIALAGKDKAILGANAVLPVSIAVCRALAAAKNIPVWHSLLVFNTNRPALPKPCVLLIEGGKHVVSGSNDKLLIINNTAGLAIQEIMVCPKGAAFKQQFERAKKIYNTLKKVLQKEFGSRGFVQGMEGGFTPPIKKTEQALRLVKQVSGREKIFIDAAAGEFYKNGKYNFEGKKRTAQEMLTLYKEWRSKFNVGIIEDPFAETDITAWQKCDKLGRSSQFVTKFFTAGDDLTATSAKRIAKAGKQKLINAVIIKPNQIGTVTETIDAAKTAKKFGLKIIVSHRSGETTDDFIADLAVGIGAEFIKAGGPFKPERAAKYNRLLAIEKEI